MHCVQTRATRTPPSGEVTRTRWRLGRNFRREIPVTLVPTPPRYLALPRVSIWFPMETDLPHTSQRCAMIRLCLSLDLRYLYLYPHLSGFVPSSEAGSTTYSTTLIRGSPSPPVAFGV